MRRALIDFALVQVGWFACVLGGAAGEGWIGPVSVGALLAIHLAAVTPPGSRGVEIRNVVVLGLIGTAIDCIQVQLGVLRFAGAAAVTGEGGAAGGVLWGLPLWMAALWFLFPILFNTSLAWLHGHPALAPLLGLVGGVLAYVAGESLGALTFGSERAWSIAAVGVAWAAYTPAALYWSRH
ncbi:MAG: DUF2878 domain-containing protein [Planctomycetota bacterium]|jgi:hypothetical protein